MISLDELATLAALGLLDDEKEQLESDTQDILGFVEEMTADLDEEEMDDVDLSFGERAPLREEDEPIMSLLDPSDMAPDWDDGFFQVPGMFTGAEEDD